MLFRYNFVEQLSSLAELGDKIDILLILEVLVKLQDIRMVNLLQYLDFGLKSLLILDLLLAVF